MWMTIVYVVSALWAGYMLGQLSAHHWYYNFYKSALKRRIHRPQGEFDSVQSRLAKKGKKRLELMDRQAAESDLRRFSVALMAGFAYFLREYFSSW